jgi:hypothetical protein
MILTLVSISVFVFGLGARTARASKLETLTGGTTTLTFTVDLNALDVDVSPLGNTQMVAPGTFVLPITSGQIGQNPLRGSMESHGSGLEFDGHGATIDMEDLEFSIGHKVVKGDLSSGPLSLSTGVFKLVQCVHDRCTGSNDPNDFGLFLRAQAADFFENDVFHGNGFDDSDQIALARFAPAASDPVPEPGLMTLFGVALGGLALVRRRSA